MSEGDDRDLCEMRGANLWSDGQAGCAEAAERSRNHKGPRRPLERHRFLGRSLPVVAARSVALDLAASA